jgi:pimeloyl-ACP methyl ester carboxylesterase
MGRADRGVAESGHRPAEGTTTREVEVAWSGETLEGTIHLPAGDGPHPGVVMVQGSGPGDRDSGGYFVEVRAALLGVGIAAASVDRPGCGRSTGDWRHHDLADRATQTGAVLDAVRDDPAIDADAVGVWGHSQGGWVVQLLAASPAAQPAFAVTSSGPSIGVEQQDRYACEHTMRARGADEAAIGEALTHLAALHDAARAGHDFAAVEARLIAPARGQPWNDGHLDIADADDWGLFQRLIQERHRPLDALARVACPFLAVFGGRDLLVPAWASAADCGRALAEAETTSSAIIVFPDGDHRLQDPAGGFVPGYLELLARWGSAAVGRT